MSHAIRLKAPGGPENLVWEAVDVPPPGPGEALIRQHFIGLNFIDVYHRSGLYPLPYYPHGIGMEAAGVVEAVGEGVSSVAVGDRVAYIHGPVGAYAERRNMLASRLVRLPEAIPEEQGAAMMLKGLTAWYLLHRTYPVCAGCRILVHAAAGGVGTILLQWAKALGAAPYAVVGNEAKAEVARRYGAHDVIVQRHEDDPAAIARRVRELTGGEGVEVVYDSVGKATFEASLDSLAPRGMMVSFGNASGPVPAFAPLELARRGSLFFTRPSLSDYIRTDREYREGAEALLSRVAAGEVEIAIGQRYALREAAQAHRDLEAGRTVGASVLVA